ncbi:hypothetical protein HUT19_39595 [Streptomyces sp. NA02950]|uniref:hypothetical protein n=1 Tax=Streptomyces sp. NA02950 TaxID=2742137 RepID=UPI0015903A79|nr:hypothetical protein [Streptomyces sp. NA02950]QKV97044.1 hypothetical protein HUT19_39595 [Streptomyces sp. NA02950]
MTGTGSGLTGCMCPLGPVLPDWPAGLVLRLALQGDVVQCAEICPVRAAGAPGQAYWDEPWLRAARGERVERGRAARRLRAAHPDSAARFLAVCGWDDLAARARGVRDEVVDGRDVADELRAVVRRAERSWALRRLVTGLGPLPAPHARAAGVSGPLVAGGASGASAALLAVAFLSLCCLERSQLGGELGEFCAAQSGQSRVGQAGSASLGDAAHLAADR